jgi:hypothetical protein
MKALIQKLSQIAPAILRHLLSQNTRAYEHILHYVRTKPDIWVTTQGDYIQWWRERDAMCLCIEVKAGACYGKASSPRAVIEHFPGRFLETNEVACPASTFTGEVKITIDPTLPQRALLLELLRREGILNVSVAPTGDFHLTSAELQPLLTKIEADMHKRTLFYPGRPLEEDVQAVRQLVANKLAAHNLPLLRVWYHPRVNGIVPRAVFSPRYDVDRAITNLAAIRRLERKYKVESTLYIRTFCPFYTEREVEALARSPWCSEIALHGEFVTNAQRFGSECAAAKAEKEQLERVTGRPVLGVGMHGGELTLNRSMYTNGAIHDAGLLYDTTPRPVNYYFPFRPYINGSFNSSYGLAHALSDVNIPPGWRYGQRFYKSAIAMMEQIYQANGVFVLMMHPIYFGFFRYLARPKNSLRLIRYLAKYMLRKAVSV